MGVFDSVDLRNAGLQKKTSLVSMSGASATAVAAIPAGAVVVGVQTEVVTGIGGAIGFDVGDGSDVDRWGASISGAASTKSGNADWTSGVVECFPTGGDVVLTAVGGSFSSGDVDVVVIYMQR